MSPVLFTLAHLAVLAYALVSGVFLAFSDFIMRALSVTSGHGGAEAMQAINREVFRWIFMVLFLGLAPLSLLIAAYGAIVVENGAGMVMMLAGLTYLVGCFGVTVVFNVPMNETLAGMEASADATLDYWTGTYLPRWSFWNTVRTVACGLSAALLLFSLAWAAQSQAQAV
ncbi:DUF1772 domain-containing protein [Antarctobacter heliothermus]|uniref:Uncharacterized membrane protein n=1 Tax=Antarctobacter heliothermus TaxID=74033 RepID=A0A239LHE0_9RHOB|nr:anthrone oxygenase family protein [Antarctobacter heliothermus]SNT29881.1 Uncharacterized membrane protein [Antarctobacter heliothermus]